MKRVVLVLVLVVGCVGAPEQDPNAWPISRAELERSIPSDDPAEVSYRTYCLACHGVDGRGAGGVTGANFTSPEGPLARPDSELLVSIRQGRQGAIGRMPAHGTILGDDGTAAVLAYVRHTFGPDIVPTAELPDADVDAAIDAGAQVR